VSVFVPRALKPLAITATGRGTRQVVRTDRYGFPLGAAGRVKRVEGYQTGDLARLNQPRGKYAGRHVGRLAGIRADGRLDIAAATGKITRWFVISFCSSEVTAMPTHIDENRLID
jgi:hypothetical protein